MSNHPIFSPLWPVKTLGEVAKVVTGKTPSTKCPEYYGGDIPFVKPSDLDGEGPLDSTEQTVTVEGARQAPPLPVGSVLVSCIGNLGKTAILGRDAICNQQINAILPTESLLPEFVYWWAKTIGPWMRANASATTVSILNKGRFERAPIPIPPIEEQRRIASRISEMMERSRRARMALDGALKDTKHFLPSVLIDGLTGGTRLVVDEDCLGTGEQTALPGGWSFRRLGELTSYGPKNGYSPASSPKAKGTQTLRLSATTSGRLILNDETTKRIEESIDPGSDLWLRPGDLLIQRANTLQYVGTAAVYDGPANTYIYPDLMMRVRFDNHALGEWVANLLNSPFGRAWVRAVATGTAGNMPKISGASLKQMWVPVPPADQLVRLVTRMRDAQVKVSRLAEMLDEQRASLSILEQSILGRAFSGSL